MLPESPKLELNIGEAQVDLNQCHQKPFTRRPNDLAFSCEAARVMSQCR